MRSLCYSHKRTPDLTTSKVLNPPSLSKGSELKETRALERYSYSRIVIYGNHVTSLLHLTLQDRKTLCLMQTENTFVGPDYFNTNGFQMSREAADTNITFSSSQDFAIQAGYSNESNEIQDLYCMDSWNSGLC